MRTDASEGYAREIAAGLQRAHDGLGARLGCPDSDLARPVEVIAVTEREPLRELLREVPEQTWWLDGRSVVLTGAESAVGSRLARHVSAHRWLTRCHRRAPAWLVEGFARLAEDEELQVAGVFADEVRGLGPTAFETGEEAAAHREAAGALVASLLGGSAERRAAFQAYLQAIDEGVHEDEAWTRHLDALVVGAGVEAGSVERETGDPRSPPVVHAGALSLADSAVARATVWLAAGRPEEARDETDGFETPGAVVVRARATAARENDVAEAARLLEPALGRHGSDPTLLEAFVSLALEGRASGRAHDRALDRLRRVAPERARILEARLALLDGNDEGAQRLAHAALDADPDCADCRWITARALVARHDIAGAGRHLRLAWVTLAHGDPERAAQLDTILAKLPDAAGEPGNGGRGTLSRERIRAVIRERIPSVRACYEHLVDRYPSIEGRVVAQFIIGPVGLVSSAALAEGAVDDPLFARPLFRECVLRQIRSLVFPPPGGWGLVGVNYPFVFSVEG